VGKVAKFAGIRPMSPVTLAARISIGSGAPQRKDVRHG